MIIFNLTRTAMEANGLTAVAKPANMPQQRPSAGLTILVATKVIDGLVAAVEHHDMHAMLRDCQHVSYGVLLDLLREAADSNSNHQLAYERVRALAEPLMAYANFVRTPNNNTVEQNEQILLGLEGDIRAGLGKANAD
jgi:hypothetical protein